MSFSTIGRSARRLCGTAALLLIFFAREEAAARQIYNIPVTIEHQAGDEITPKIVAAGSRGGALVFWIGGGAARNSLVAQYLSPAGFPAVPGGARLLSRTHGITAFDVAIDTNDGIFLAWAEATSKGLSAAYVQYFSPEGAPAWDRPLRLGSTSRQQVNPKIAFDQTEAAYVVWEDLPLLTGPVLRGKSLVAQRISTTGTNLWPDAGIQIVRNTQASFRAEILPFKGGLAVAWENHADDKVYFRSFKQEAGTPFTGTAILPGAAAQKMARPRIAVVDTNDPASKVEFFIVWTQEQAQTGVDIFAQRITLAGKLRWGKNGVAVSESDGDQTNYEIARDTEDGFYAVWQDTRNPESKIYIQRVDPAGKLLFNRNGVALSDGSGNQLHPRIASNLAKGAYCVWEDDRNGTLDVYAQEVKKSGKLLWRHAGGQGIPVSVQNGEQTAVNAFTMPDARFAVAWQDTRQGDADIFAQYILRDGTLDNVPPRISSIPDTVVTSGAAYQYQVQTLEVDHDFPLEFRLLQGPAWLEMDAQTGLLAGAIPPATSDAAQLVEPITVEVADNRGATTAQAFNLHILAGNRPPTITSEPPLSILEDSDYFYQIIFSDPDTNDTHTFVGSKLPPWLHLDGTRGVLSGTPLNEHVGTAAVAVSVKDQNGASDTQEFTITVINTNDPPQFDAAVPPATTREDELFSFDFQATDPDIGDTLRFSLPEAPSWLTLDPQSGLLSGTPANDDIGQVVVTVQVEDLAGATDALTFDLTVENTNDPPFFTSVPDTFAYVDSLYRYVVHAADVDPADELSIMFLAGPAWADWDPQTLQLSGKPGAADVGSTSNVAFDVRDKAGELAEQRFRITVFRGAKPDSTAPPPPASLAVDPPGWTRADRISLIWQTPSDPSGVIAAYAKIGGLPQNADDFDVRHTVTVSTGTPDSLEFSPALEGIVPVYLWFEDGAGNRDISNSASVFYKLDRTPPDKPIAIFPAAWSRPDTVRFLWLRTSDNRNGSGLQGYRIVVEPQVADTPVAGEEIAPDTLESRLALGLADTFSKFFSWKIVASDSAGNTAASDTLAFSLDATLPLIIHAPLDTVDAGTDVRMAAEVTDTNAGVDRVEVLYRTAGENGYRAQKLEKISTESTEYVTIISGKHVKPAGLEYVIRASDLAGNIRTLQSGSSFSIFRSLIVRAKDIVAPRATFEDKYQMVSVPFQVPESSIHVFFENNFGAYDDRMWRLLRYRDGGYVELPQPAFGKLQPGTAYWLITRKGQAWKTQAVASIKTDAPYELTLQPGWNMIGTPYAFDTDWTAADVPEGVQPVLWGFDGAGYQMETASMESWKGYFLFNSANTAQTLRIVPAGAAGKAKKAGELWPGMDWAVRVRAELNDMQDAANYFGIGMGARDGRDERDFPEPPEIGDALRLYFPHSDWPGNDGAYATDFRRSGAAGQAWDFTVENLQPGRLQLSFIPQRGLPDSLSLQLVDVSTATKNFISFDTPVSLTISAGEKKRTFAIRLISKANAGEVTEMPARVSLYPAWPNPYKKQSGRNVVFRFSLQQDAVVALRIFNLLGQEVFTAHSGARYAKGRHALTWNGRDEAGRAVAAGIYLVNLIVDQRKKVQQKIIILN